MSGKDEERDQEKTPFNFSGYITAEMIDALTCPVNRHATMVEHSCDEHELHKNPGLLIMHYHDNGGADFFRKRRKEFEREAERRSPIDVTEVPDLLEIAKTRKFSRNEVEEIVDALTCPINRYSTMLEYSCDEYELHRRPGLLLKHYYENGGALEFWKHHDESKERNAAAV